MNQNRKIRNFILGKQTISNLQREQQGLVIGGYDDWDTELDLWGSRVTCTTNFDTGNCGASKTCKFPICVPCDTTIPVCSC